MRRPAFELLSTLAVSICAFHSAPALGQDCSFEIHATPATGVAPLPVRVMGDAYVYEILVNIGGEAEYYAFTPDPYGLTCRTGWRFTYDHQFDCPGTYEVVVMSQNNPDFRETTTVTVSPPLMPYLFILEESPYSAYLGVHYDIAQRPFDYATVDWGDGNVHTFTWELRGLYMGTPTHVYAVDGNYTASVTHHYSGPHCSWSQTMTANMRIPNPATPVSTSTWGGVKALYR